eukprot:TRINITY_DN69873_c0_g1_i1.p1 TRINITY_DN69873_c0_g1~~TRINITY_DN69873_c0_g1_i1.p1  ORF type:complete len:115 (+),score=4.69 TRINITY_DN69873_c0_g1_i1:104-448(+)
MSSAKTFSVSSGKAPPLKGSFPLDHLQECRAETDQFMACLERNGHMAAKCRDETKAYIQCRMDKGLMMTEPMSNFGIPNEPFKFDESMRHKGAKLHDPKLRREDPYVNPSETGR